jgi:glycosyltransferase 2 family protein
LSLLRRLILWPRKHWNWLKWPVALLVLGYLFYANREKLAELQSHPIQWPLLILAFLVAGASITLTFYRWFLLVWAQDFPFTVRDALRLGYIAYLFNYFGPGAVGGDFFKAAMIASEQQSRRGIAAATVLLDRILGLLALFMVAALATCFLEPDMLRNPTIKTLAWSFWISSAVGVAGLGILLHPSVPRSRLLGRLVRLPKIGNTVGSMVNAVLLYQSRRRILVLTVLLSIVGHFGMLTGFYLCSRAIHEERSAPGYWGHLLLIPGAEVFAVVLPVPGGVGTLEGAVGASYQIANEARGTAAVPSDQAIAAGVATALAYRVLTLVIAAIGAGYYLISRGAIRRVLAEAGPATQAGEGSLGG